MTSKRFKKLCMGLGISKRDAEYMIKTAPKGRTNQRKFDTAFVAWYTCMNIRHPVYERKASEAVKIWVEDGIPDGEAVKIVGRCYQATKDMIVIDKRKKDENG